jgi:hypothetical protein
VIRFDTSIDPHGERRDWGVLMKEFGSGKALSAELWSASHFLPATLLHAVPPPGQNSNRTDGFSQYDRKADIFWFRVGGSQRIVKERFDWGFLERDAETADLTAVELWQPGRYLPADLLDAAPGPRSIR